MECTGIAWLWLCMKSTSLTLAMKVLIHTTNRKSAAGLCTTRRHAWWVKWSFERGLLNAVTNQKQSNSSACWLGYILEQSCTFRMSCLSNDQQQSNFQRYQDCQNAEVDLYVRGRAHIAEVLPKSLCLSPPHVCQMCVFIHNSYIVIPLSMPDEVDVLHSTCIMHESCYSVENFPELFELEPL